MTSLIIVAVFVSLMGAALFFANKQGKEKVKNDQLEKGLKDVKKDQDIQSEPNKRGSDLIDRL